MNNKQPLTIVSSSSAKSQPPTESKKDVIVAAKSKLTEHDAKIWNLLFESAKARSLQFTNTNGKGINNDDLQTHNNFVFSVKKPSEPTARIFFVDGMALLFRLAWVDDLKNLSLIKQYLHSPPFANAYMFDDIDSHVFSFYHEYLYRLDCSDDILDAEPREILRMAMYMKDSNFLVWLVRQKIPLLFADVPTMTKERYDNRKRKWNFFAMLFHFEKHLVPLELRLLYVQETLFHAQKIVKRSTTAKRPANDAFVQDADNFFLAGPVINTSTFAAQCKTLIDIVFYEVKRVAKHLAAAERLKANYSKIEKLFDSLLLMGTRAPIVPKELVNDAPKEFAKFATLWIALMKAFPLDVIDDHHLMFALQKFVPFNPALFPKTLQFDLCFARFEMIEITDLGEDDDEYVEDNEDGRDGVNLSKKNPLSKKRKHQEVDLDATLSDDEAERKIKHTRTPKDRKFVVEDFTDDESFDDLEVLSAEDETSRDVIDVDSEDDDDDDIDDDIED